MVGHRFYTAWAKVRIFYFLNIYKLKGKIKCWDKYIGTFHRINNTNLILILLIIFS